MLLKKTSITCLCIFLFSCAIPAKKESVDTNAWQLNFSPVEVTQLLQGVYGERRFAFQIAVSLNESRLSLVGLDSFGRRAFSILWDQTGVSSTQASWVPKTIHTKEILNNLMLTFWPLNVLRQNYAGQVTQVGNKRLVMQGGNLVMSISNIDKENLWVGKRTLENHLLGYRLDIQSSIISSHS